MFSKIASLPVVATASYTWSSGGRFLYRAASQKHRLKMSVNSIGGHRSFFSTASPNGASKSGAAHQAENLVIVGGGIAGLATAAALRSIAGISSIRILEQSSETIFRNDRSGAATQLGPNGLRALRAIGGENLLNKVMSSGTKLAGNTILVPGAPQPMTTPDTAEDDTGLPQVLMHWGVLRSILADLTPSGSIAYGTGDDVVGYKIMDDDGVLLVNGNGDVVGPFDSAPLIIGADGINSTFRRCLATDNCELGGIEERQIGVKYNKRVNIKAVVESKLGDDHEPNHTVSFFSPGGAIACFAGPAGDGFTYWAISVADTTTGTDAEDDIIKLAFHSNMDKASMKAALLKRLGGLDQPLCDFAVEKIEATDAKFIFVQFSKEAEQMGPSLVSTDGRVVLVGDAAHAMSPAYGQAANFALEDAASLAVCVRDADTLEMAFKAYEASRLDRCSEMQQRSADRAAMAMKGEHAEDVTKWIFKWDVPDGRELLRQE